MATLFDGATFNQERDGDRLAGQLGAVYEVLSDGRWHKATELERRVGSNWASINARIRDLRKPRFGGHKIARRNVGGGLWEYRMEVAA